MTNTSAVTALLAAPIRRAYCFYAKVEIARSNVSRGEKFKKLLICATSALVGDQMEGSIWLTEYARAMKKRAGSR